MTLAHARVRNRAFALLAALVIIWPVLVLAAASPSRVLAAGAVRLAVTGFADPTTAGVVHSFTVSALKSNGNLDNSYGGTVHLTSSDGQAVLPADTTLINGTRTFTATLKTAGEQSITARDTLVATIAGSQTAITVNPDVAASVVFHDTGFNGEPLDTKTGTPIYSVCRPSTTTAPCASSPTSTGVQVLVRDQFGNRVLPTLIALTNNATAAGLGSATTSNGIADFGNQPVVATLGATRLKATAPTGTPGISNEFQVAVDVKGCTGQKCDNSGVLPQQKAFNQITTGSNFFVDGTTNVLLRTQFLQTSDFAPGVDTCGATTGLVGQGTEALSQGSGLAAAMPSTSMLIVISKAALQANGLTQRSAASFNICVGATWIDPDHAAVPWAAKNAAGQPVDAQLAGGAYWGLARNCSELAANAIDPCIAVATKSTKDVQAYFGWTSAQVAQYMENSDLALIVRKRFGWDGKAGIFK